MSLITSDSQITALIPNTFAVGRGEDPLRVRIASHIEAAEQFLHTDILPGDILTQLQDTLSSGDTPSSGAAKVILAQAVTIVAAHAIHSALPSLDLVLTSSGFGIASTESVAPASRHRVEALRASLLSTRDEAILRIVPLLAQIPSWVTSEQGCRFRSTLLGFSAARTSAPAASAVPSSYDEFKAALPQIISIESDIAHTYISHELMRMLRLWNLHIGTAAWQGLAGAMAPGKENAVRTLISITKSAVGLTMQRDTLLSAPAADKRSQPYTVAALSRRIHGLLSSAVALIESHPGHFPEWHSSPTALLFSRPRFRNSPSSGGYFF